MPTPTKKSLELDHADLRWRLDHSSLGFADTSELEPIRDIIGQSRGVEAFRFGMSMQQEGYNIFVTGWPGSGRLSTVKKLLAELMPDGEVPDDLAYVNNFERPDQPVLLCFPAGKGSVFKRGMAEFLENLTREAPQLFESQEYIQRKNEIAEAHEQRIISFYKTIEDKVKDTGLVVVRMQLGPLQRPDVLPLVDGEPKRLIDLEEMVEHGRFPREEYERLKDKRAEIKDEVDEIVHQVRELQKQVEEKQRDVDKLMFRTLAEEHIRPLRDSCENEKVAAYLDAVLDHLVNNIDTVRMAAAVAKGQTPQGMPPFMAPKPEQLLHDYQVNLIVDNQDLQGPPTIVESYPTYRNLFGSIERVMQSSGGWRTDFTMIRAGSFVRAGGGYLVVNLWDAIFEPGVWPTLKRSLKTKLIEIETYDPLFYISSVGIKPEPIPMNVKVVVLGDPWLYGMLLHYDQDVAKIFKVRADYETVMERSDEAVAAFARFVAAQVEEGGHPAFQASAVAGLVEEAVRMAGRREKLSTAFPRLSDLVAEAAWFARQDKATSVTGAHVEQAIAGRIRRSNQIEERIQEMIDRGTLFVDVSGEVVGQVNGLAVYQTGDYAFGKPTRITVTTAMGREGIINIEREAELSGPTHNKGVYILAGYLRRNFAQDKPLSLAASIAFEQSYGGVDGDSASSTELYALLSSLSGAPIRQDVAITGSVNQKGEVQPIGGVNEKIEGFYYTCKNTGLTGTQGVMIPRANVKDLMLRQEVADAVKAGQFHVWAVSRVEEGIELLTGKKAGTRTKAGGYTKGSIFALVDDRLKALAHGLRDFAKDEEKEGKGGKKRK
jgi:lon-related putative ATP-dependent protease